MPSSSLPLMESPPGPEGIMRFAVCSGHSSAVIADLLAALKDLL